MAIITIGKAPDNMCVFPNPTVSKHHAELNVDPTNPSPHSGVIIDKNSMNGTYVNGKRITGPTTIGLNDTILVGSQQTSLADIMAKAKATHIQIPKRPGSKSIGRSKDSDIMVNLNEVSSRHASIWLNEAGTVVIEDCGSRNGTYVNGMKITSTELHPGDVVKLAGTYTLDWQSIFKPVPPPPTPNSTWKIVAAVCAALILICGGYWWYTNMKWDKEKIYDTYSDTVCLVLADYGYKVMVGDDDMTQQIFGAPIICLNKDGELTSGTSDYSGTAFFISENGKLATNLHIIKPWLFEENTKALTKVVREYFAALGAFDPRYTALMPEVNVVGELQNLYIVPNGLPVSETNAIKCTVVNGGDDVEKDVAIIQTDNRKLPDKNIHILSLENADLSPEALKQGKTIYTIGYPYGLSVGMIKGKEIQNQVHEGAITQERGEYEFGHDAATAGGASGSPIINDKGRLVGIHHAGMTGVTGAQGFNWAIKAKHLKNIADK